MIWRRDYWQRDLQGEMETKLTTVVSPKSKALSSCLKPICAASGTTAGHDRDAFWRRSENAGAAHRRDFARQRRELVQSISSWPGRAKWRRCHWNKWDNLSGDDRIVSRIPAGVAAAGGLVALVAAMSSAAVADVTGVLAASAAIIGTLPAKTAARENSCMYTRQQMDAETDRTRGRDRRIRFRTRSICSTAKSMPLSNPSPLSARRSAHYQELVDRIDELDSNLRKLRPRVMRSGG